VALPPELEASAPSFQHVAATELPEHALPGGGTVRVLVGQAWGWTSPVRTASPTLYLDISLPPGAALDLPRWADELAVYSPTLPLEVAGVPLSAGEMGVWLPPGSDTGPADAPLAIQAGAEGARFVVIGGQALPQPVRMWWNFVASTREGLAEAAQRWAAGGFPSIPGETERVDGPVWRG
ncbi:pirin-like C-terminal cupin domain-containing protein, partial [Ideonella sp.]|uniref:pirin-like C-terminal cupin domain-containing protein n=1 Tax=Ideonella sp. TaxID=1929293 RepID=UPI003BB57109